jgi:hypothetical protein
LKARPPAPKIRGRWRLHGKQSAALSSICADPVANKKTACSQNCGCHELGEIYNVQQVPFNYVMTVVFLHAAEEQLATDLLQHTLIRSPILMSRWRDRVATTLARLFFVASVFVSST